MTYAETRGETPFDWNAVLAAEPPEIGSERHCDLSDLAHSWVTCACGNQCATLERNILGKPEDSRLWILGGDFAQVITHCNWAAAKRILAEIEKRAAELLETL